MAKAKKNASKKKATKKRSPSSVKISKRKSMPKPVELAARYMVLMGGDIDCALWRLKEETLLLNTGIRPLRRGMKCAGLAVTWNAVLGCHNPVPDDSKTVKNWNKIQDVIHPGSVFVYQPGGEMSSGHLGNMYGNIIHSRGATGAIIDGNCRDSDGHERMENWSIFSRGASPLEAASRIKWMEANTPVLMSGELRKWIEVKPGDFVFADGDGVIIIPKKLIMPVLLDAEGHHSKEVEAEKLYAAGEDPEKVMEEYGVA